MGNLGGYQLLTTAAKFVGGPEILVGLLFGAGAVAGGLAVAGGGAIKKNASKAAEEKRRKEESAVVHTVHTEGESNEGLLFEVGDKFRVLNSDGDAGLIEKIGDENNPYFVSLRFLEKISDYALA